MKERIKEIVNFLLCVAVLVGIAYYTGILKGFSFDEISYSYNNFVKNLSSIKISKNYKTAPSSKTQSYSGHSPRRIPEAVLQGSRSAGMWKQLFSGNKKIVFYVYSDGSNGNELSKDFDSAVANYIYSSNNYYYYQLQAYDVSTYNSLKSTVDIGPSKICNSLQECNDQRKRAGAYSTLAEFVSRCARTMCIINNKTNEYIILRNRDSKNAMSVLQQYKSW